MHTYQLFMGRNIPSGGYVDDQQWTQFLSIVDTIIDGYTVQDVDGVWKGEHECTKLMSICTDNTDAVTTVARLYKDTFSQDSVGMQVLPAMSFV